MTLLRLLALVCLGGAALSWVAPSLAFDAILAGDRAVATTVATDTTAWTAISISTCAGHITQGTCTVKIYDNGTASQTYRVTLQSDASAATNGFTLDGNAASGGIATGNSVAIGASSSLVITILAGAGCPIACPADRTTKWMIEGTNTGALTSREENYVITVHYT